MQYIPRSAITIPPDRQREQVTAEDSSRLNGYVTAIMEKAQFDSERFKTEVRRAMAGGRPVA